METFGIPLGDYKGICKFTKTPMVRVLSIYQKSMPLSPSDSGLVSSEECCL